MVPYGVPRGAAVEPAPPVVEPVDAARGGVAERSVRAWDADARIWIGFCDTRDADGQ